MTNVLQELYVKATAESVDAYIDAYGGDPGVLADRVMEAGDTATIFLASLFTTGGAVPISSVQLILDVHERLFEAITLEMLPEDIRKGVKALLTLFRLAVDGANNNAFGYSTSSVD